MPGYGIVDATPGAGLLPWSRAFERLSIGGQSAKARNLALNHHCVVTIEIADEAVIVEGVATRWVFC